MTTPKFVNAHSSEWIQQARLLTKTYFEWMNREIIEACHFSIPDIVGMPLDVYLENVAKTICPDDALHSVYYLLVIDDRAVGMGGLRRLPDGHGEIVRIYVDPSCRGQKLGSMLMRRLISEAENLGYSRLYLDTGVFMKSAHRLYESYGFVDCNAYAGAEPPVALHPYWRFMTLDKSQWKR
jgi:GNAT superfamily N-acetyltransferase